MQFQSKKESGMSESASKPANHTATVTYDGFVIQARAISINQKWETVFRVTKDGHTAKAWTKGDMAALPDAGEACQAGIRQAMGEIDQGLIAPAK
jgi:hypothetical protein